jgi:hypothetical protein
LSGDGRRRCSSTATTYCHDYPGAFSLADPLAARRAVYDHALDELDPRPFRPFSPRGWSRAGFEGADTCLQRPVDPTAGASRAPGPHPHGRPAHARWRWRRAS